MLAATSSTSPSKRKRRRRKQSLEHSKTIREAPVSDSDEADGELETVNDIEDSPFSAVPLVPTAPGVVTMSEGLNDENPTSESSSSSEENEGEEYGEGPDHATFLASKSEFAQAL